MRLQRLAITGQEDESNYEVDAVREGAAGRYNCSGYPMHRTFQIGERTVGLVLFGFILLVFEISDSCQ